MRKRRPGPATVTAPSVGQAAGGEETEGDLIVVYSSLTRGGGGAGTDVFSVVTSDRTRGKGLQLCQGRIKLDIRERFFTQRVFGRWNRLPREVVTAPSLTEFKKRLDDVLRHTV
ncbi:hypothetical protein BTVI_21811 [Pitangus sulphuratus]|nr:hypothetical protein BTVI_21811 [Pitangus sulphuratus]